MSVHYFTFKGSLLTIEKSNHTKLIKIEFVIIVGIVEDLPIVQCGLKYISDYKF